ncbi:aminoacyl-tRNA hydrolase [Rubripirellula reticaptiva]|uniref:Peptidyl-tRNA hydrolase n=1 Tax=Rubripirellula reticaptiva TaxID=2528013 RepID=A0A5C6F5L8_9BACT|nr:aminoacyl-tRNA hydrolase [Rubripirellula reticaptiva]TWU55717.1 Peptidyl-tRNA hydrolase [Rubripirellula reticaptiva]
MKLIVGLGNPGNKYDQTRHNIGFVAVEKIASLISASPSKTKFDGLLAEAVTSGKKVALLWPQTYMNASGQSVRRAVDFYKIDAEDVLVVCDDLNLASGKVRLRASGSAGGQKGLSDTIRHLQTDSFARLKIGIGRPPEGWEVTDYVLGKFSSTERETMEVATTAAAKAAICWATEGVAAAMNRHNAGEEKKPKKRPNQTKTAGQPKTPASDSETSDEST